VARIARDGYERDAAIVTAYVAGAYAYREVAEHFGVHLAVTV
jgi:transposase